jgi:hypothetical protein
MHRETFGAKLYIYLDSKVAGKQKNGLSGLFIIHHRNHSATAVESHLAAYYSLSIPITDAKTPLLISITRPCIVAAVRILISNHSIQLIDHVVVFCIS